MAEVTNYTDPISGVDVIEDVVGQVRRLLQRDCNLRREDGYSGGYKGKVKIELDCFAVRTAHVEVESPLIQSPSVIAPPVDSFPPDEIEAVHVEEILVIPQNENLQEVRSRISDNTAEKLEAESETTAEAEQAPEEHRAKRKYTRRAALAGAVSE